MRLKLKIILLFEMGYARVGGGNKIIIEGYILED